MRAQRRLLVLAAIGFLLSTVLPASGASPSTNWFPLKAETPYGVFNYVRVGHPACASVQVCFAPSFALTAGNRVRGYLQRLTKRGWQMTGDAQTAGSEPGGASCVSATSCWVVGASVDQSPEVLAFSEHWNGRLWTSVPLPAVASGASAQNYLNAVSCFRETSCFAVGESGTGTTGFYTVMYWDGNSWTTAAAGAPDIDLGSLSCPSTTLCAAGGSSFDATGASHAAVVMYDGQTWTPTALAEPTGAANSYVNGIACPSTSSCIAVGGYQLPNDSAFYPLAEQWNGASWSLIALPAEVQQGVAQYDDVSCLSPDQCWAVGFSPLSSSGTTYPVASMWDGTNMTLGQQSAGTNQVDFQGVTCLPGVACLALGKGAAPRRAVTTAAAVGAS